MRLRHLLLGLLASTSLLTCSPTGKQDSEQALTTQANAIIAKMTLEEKIGQVIQADISSVTPEDARTYNLGSVLNGGNSAPGGSKVADPQAWIDLADAFWDASTDTSDGGVGIPLLWGTDAVHGHNNLQTATIFPHNSALGAMHNPDLMRKIGDVTAREIRATGLDWTFAPTLAVARDDRWGRTYESYSENPELVARYGKAIIEGLQGEPGTENFLIGDNVMATAKHFIGDGGTELGIDKGDTQGTMEQIIKIHGAGYETAFAADVQSVMTSFSSVNGEKMHGHKQLLNDVLRDRMGFDGFVVGDWNGHAEIPGCTATDCPEALHAGVDMYMAPDSWKGLYESLLAQAKAGEIDMARLDEAVQYILKAKIRSGLLGAGKPSTRVTSDISILGHADHRAVARQAVRESLVLLKNADNILPLAPGKTVLVTGSGAHSMQQQTGGWTLNWQGTGNDNDEFANGETIFEGLEQAIKAQGGTAILAENGQMPAKPDVAIVVFGEQPYAEYRGDRSDLVFEFEDGENLALINSLKAKGIPVVSVFLTGRPLWINPHLNASDAFVVGWLPGTEGGGVADVLVTDKNGKAQHNFKGRLSFSWPSDGTGKPINQAGDTGVLFPYGYGLKYGVSETFKPLSEDPGIAQIGNTFKGQIFSRGDAASPFQLYLGDSSNLNTPVTGLSGASLGGGITVAGTDYKAQEDARTLTWSGNGKASFSIRTRRSIELSSVENDRNALFLHWRINESLGRPLTLSMGCGEGCAGILDISGIVESVPAGEWVLTQIPLSCFKDAGLKPDSVTTLLEISSAHETSITIHAAQIAPNMNSVNACPAMAK